MRTPDFKKLMFQNLVNMIMIGTAPHMSEYPSKSLVFFLMRKDNIPDVRMPDVSVPRRGGQRKSGKS